MKVAAIVVNYNDAENTVKYVKKISEYEKIQRIVVVDNASSQLNQMNLLKEVENEKVVILQSGKNAGYGYGNNFGARYLEEQGENYDYLIISNADIEIEASAINRCLEVLAKDEKIAMVAPRMYNARKSANSQKQLEDENIWLRCHSFY